MGMPHQRKGGPNSFEYGSYSFSQKKRRAEDAKRKGPTVSHQSNQDINVPNKQFCYSVAFINSLCKKGRTELLQTSVRQFLPQEKGGRRSKVQGACSFLSKEALCKGAADMNELHCCVCNLSVYSFA